MAVDFYESCACGWYLALLINNKCGLGVSQLDKEVNVTGADAVKEAREKYCGLVCKWQKVGRFGECLRVHLTYWSKF